MPSANSLSISYGWRSYRRMGCISIMRFWLGRIAFCHIWLWLGRRKPYIIELPLSLDELLYALGIVKERLCIF